MLQFMRIKRRHFLLTLLGLEPEKSFISFQRANQENGICYPEKLLGTCQFLLELFSDKSRCLMALLLILLECYIEEGKNISPYPIVDKTGIKLIAI